MECKYGFQGYDKEHMVCATGRDMSISTKQSIEIANFLRSKPVLKVQVTLQRVIKQEMAIPFRRFNADMGHKPGIGPGRYPIKACTAILKLVNSAISNAQFKGMNASDLIVKHIAAQKGAANWHYGRKRRRIMKRTSIELVLEEVAKKTEKKADEKKPKPVEEKQATPKATEEKQTTPKPVEEKQNVPKATEVKTEAKPKEVTEKPKVEVKKEETKVAEKPVKTETKEEKKVEVMEEKAPEASDKPKGESQ